MNCTFRKRNITLEKKFYLGWERFPRTGKGWESFPAPQNLFSEPFSSVLGLYFAAWENHFDTLRKLYNTLRKPGSYHGKTSRWFWTGTLRILNLEKTCASLAKVEKISQPFSRFPSFSSFVLGAAYLIACVHSAVITQRELTGQGQSRGTENWYPVRRS